MDQQVPIVCGCSLLILLDLSLAAVCKVVSVQVVLQTPADRHAR